MRGTSFALLCIFAAGGAVEWALRGVGWRRYAGAALCLLLALQAFINVGEIRDQRTIAMTIVDRREAARAVLKRGPIPCFPLVVPASRVRQLAAVWTQTPLEDVVDGHAYAGRGTYLTGTASAMEGVVTLYRRAGTAASVPTATRVLREKEGWQVRELCGG